MVQHERFVKDKQGRFRLKSFDENEVVYCHRVCHEPAGFSKGARVR
jgi:aspartate/tyrosine/aromatic aminotransferase